MYNIDFLNNRLNKFYKTDSKIILLTFSLFLTFQTLSAKQTDLFPPGNKELISRFLPKDTIILLEDTTTKNDFLETEYGLVELNNIAGLVEKIN